MLRDEAKRYIDYELEYGENRALYHYNCAEIMLYSCNDYYNLGLDKKALNMIIPFGGGICTENTCGILTGGVAAIGAMFSEDKPTTNIRMKTITKEWIEEFEKEFKDTNCKIIKDVNLEADEKCGRLILKAAEILEDILNKNLKG